VGLTSELKIKSYSTLKISRSSVAGCFNSEFFICNDGWRAFSVRCL